jgi:hypothetical protein
MTSCVLARTTNCLDGMELLKGCNPCSEGDGETNAVFPTIQTCGWISSPSNRGTPESTGRETPTTRNHGLMRSSAANFTSLPIGSSLPQILSDVTESSTTTPSPNAS